MLTSCKSAVQGNILRKYISSYIFFYGLWSNNFKILVEKLTNAYFFVVKLKKIVLCYLIFKFGTRSSIKITFKNCKTKRLTKLV